MDFQLNDEQLQLKKSVREFAEREIAPNVMKWDEAGEFPLATVKELGKLGLLGISFPARVRRRRDGLRRIRHRDRGTLARGRLSRHHRGGAHLAVLEPYFSCRQRGAEKEICQPLATRRIHRRLGTDRTILRIGRGQRAHDRGPQRKHLGAERHQDLLHQWPLCRRSGGDCRHRPRGPHHGLSAFIVEKGTKGFVRGKKKTSWDCGPATPPN